MLFNIFFINFDFGYFNFYDLDSKVDYILEWNYFLILLFFYLLSFFMWKKNA